MSLLDPPPPYEPGMHRSKSDRGHRRAKHLKHVADTIDKLDSTSFGGPYHHGGPYDAALRSFNINSQFSPVAATEVGNKAAWKATPREAQLDALLRGRPLDRIASVPPGERALNGEVMEYEYGTDMLRDPDAGGGPYKRWPGIKYHPDDLKGKGEPAFTVERQGRAAKAAAIDRSKPLCERRGGRYEVVPQYSVRQAERHTAHLDARPTVARQRSSSAAAAPPSRSREFADGLRHRIRSLRHT